jgi:hypothetical protein
MNNKISYSAPALEVLELEVENAILAASGEYSIPEFESFSVPDFEEF